VFQSTNSIKHISATEDSCKLQRTPELQSLLRIGSIYAPFWSAVFYPQTKSANSIYIAALRASVQFVKCGTSQAL